MLKNECIPTQRPSTIATVARCGDNVLADIDSATGTVVRTYVTPMLDSNVSMTIAGATPTTYYYNADERMSVMNLTDSTSTVVQSYGYTAYGDKIDALTEGSVEQRYTYTGRELSEASGDYYFCYRWYGSWSGDFQTRDPLGYIDGASMYAGYFASLLGIDPPGLGTRSRGTDGASGRSNWNRNRSVTGNNLNPPGRDGGISSTTPGSGNGGARVNTDDIEAYEAGKEMEEWTETNQHVIETTIDIAENGTKPDDYGVTFRACRSDTCANYAEGEIRSIVSKYWRVKRTCKNTNSEGKVEEGLLYCAKAKICRKGWLASQARTHTDEICICRTRSYRGWAEPGDIWPDDFK